MNVKEFLKNFTGNNHIVIYDLYGYNTKKFYNPNDTIEQFGYSTVRE